MIVIIMIRLFSCMVKTIGSYLFLLWDDLLMTVQDCVYHLQSMTLMCCDLTLGDHGRVYCLQSMTGMCSDLPTSGDNRTCVACAEDDSKVQ